MKILIIGGVAGGATAAARIRRLDENAEIVILERTGYISYANCGLPYYIGGVITEKQALTLQTPESFWQRFRIEARTHNEAVKIDPDSKTVWIQNLLDGTTYQETYDKLILSPGAKAIRPELPGMEDERVMTLRTVEDTFRIEEFIRQKNPQRAVIIGGGFIGLEMAENLMHRGLETTLIQLDSHVLPPIDYDMACLLHAYLRQKGLNLKVGTAVQKIEASADSLCVHTDHGSVEADMVLAAVGVVPDSHLAKEAGLTLGAKGSIVTDEHMRTSAPDIYAVGDAVEVRHFVSGQKALIALAGPANKQGRIAADHICGRASAFRGSQGSSVLKLFDMTAASTGLNEQALRSAGLTYDKTITFQASHAAYYPGATNMTVKLLFSPDSGKIYGAQIIGFDGVDKRIDVLATAIRAGMTTEMLTELELAYAPPFSSAKDPVNMAGYVAENVRTGLVKQYHWDEIPALLVRDDVTLLDTRTTGEYARGHIPKTMNIPLDSLRERLGELDKTKPVYVNCQSGLRSYIACRILAQDGFDCYNLSGGYRFYETVATQEKFDTIPAHPCGLPIER